MTVTITSADAGSGLAAGSPSCTDNTSTVLTLTPSATDTWTTSVAGEGTHTIDCQATDQASNQTLKQDTVKIDTTNPTITLKKGEAVKFRVTSEDVTHGLFLRALKIDTDLEPGQTREMTVTPEKTGTFLAICHHFCGAQHGNMKLTIVVE